MAEIDGGGNISLQNPQSGPAARAGRVRKAAMVLIAAAVAVVFAASFIYTRGLDRAEEPAKEPPLITASDGPTRVRPDKPGGMIVPDRDKQVFSHIDPTETPPRIEQLLPPPEIAVARPPPVGPDMGAKPDLEQNQQLALNILPKAGPGSGEVEMLVAPRKAKTAKPARPAPPAEVKAETAAKAAPPPPAPVPKPEKKVAAPPSPPAVAKPAVAKPAVPKQVQIASVNAARKVSGWRVQIAASRSEKAARRSWRSFRRKNRDILGGLRLFLVRKDLGPKKGVFYRMQVGPLANSNAAKTLCARIKARKLGCFVVRQ